MRGHEAEWITSAEAEAKLQRQLKFDPDIWIVETERRDGAHGLDLAGT